MVEDNGGRNPIIDTNSERAKWRLTVLALTSALGAQIYFLLSDLPIPGLSQEASSGSGIAPPIAELVSARNAVKVQAPGDLVWDKAENGQILYRRQSLLTSEQSKAEIAFLDGTGIIVDENSLIQVEKTPGDDSLGYERITIRLLRGAIHKSEPRKRPEVLRKLAAQAPAIDVEFASAVATLSPASELTIRSSGEVAVRAGDVQIKTAGAAEHVVTEGEEAKIAPDGALSSRKLVFNLISPRAGESVEKGSVKFRWNVESAALGGAPMDLELSHDPGFRDVVRRVTIPAASRPLKFIETETRLPANAGRVLHWRVRPHSPHVAASAPSKFFILPSLQVQVTLPKEGARAWAEKPVDFVWKEVEGAESYEVEIQGLEAKKTRETFLRVERFPVGSVEWRVRAHFSTGSFGDWSERRRLHLIALPAEGELPPPDQLDVEIEQPGAAEPNPLHTWLDWLVRSAHAQTGDGKKVTLKWKPVKGAKKYRVQVSKTRDFKDVMVEVQSDSPQWVWSYEPGMENSKGRVFYRVASVSNSGKVGKFSAPKTVQIQRVTKLVFKEKEAPKKPVIPETYSATEPETASAPEPSPAPAPVPVPADAASATPSVAASAAAIQPEQKTSWKLGVAAGAGLGNLKQTGSGGNLDLVEMTGAYLAQHLLLDFQTAAETEAHWSGSLKANFASFEGARSASHTRGIEQGQVSAFAFRLDVAKAGPPTPDQGRAAIGLTIDRAFRWVKNGPQSVEPQGAVSVGPLLRFNNGFGPVESGALLSLPITGLLTGGHAGVNGALFGEFELLQMGPNSLGARLQAEMSYLGWKKPHSIQTFTWALWLAPTFHLGQEGDGT